MADKIAKTFDVPETLSDAVTTANILGELAISATWKRAAIVRAYVRKSQGGRPRKDGNLLGFQQVSISEFAGLGIIGLRDRNTVARYYDAWELTGLPDPIPGKPTELPTIEFPSVAGSARSELEAANEPDPLPVGTPKLGAPSETPQRATEATADMPAHSPTQTPTEPVSVAPGGRSDDAPKLADPVIEPVEPTVPVIEPTAVVPPTKPAPPARPTPLPVPVKWPVSPGPRVQPPKTGGEPDKPRGRQRMSPARIERMLEHYGISVEVLAESLAEMPTELEGAPYDNRQKLAEQLKALRTEVSRAIKRMEG